MNLKEIKEMLQLMADHDLSELEIDKDGLKVKFRKAGADRVDMHEAGVRGLTSLAPRRQESSAQFPMPAPTVDQDVLPPNVGFIKSPMVGTFYSAPAPDQPAYVQSGSKVKDGDVLCIIEAMKLMNEIKSELNGEILEVLAKNGQPIEFDQPLFKIRKG